MAEASMLLGWTPDVSLSMPCRRFFAVMRAARQLEFRKRAENYWHLTTISRVACDSVEFYNQLRDNYHKVFNPHPKRLTPKDDKLVATKLLKIFQEAGQDV